MQTTIAQYPRGMKSSWRHLTSFKGSVSSIWAAASPGDHRTTTERATTQRSCWVERPVESHHRQIFFLYVNWTLILVATPHEESLIWPHFPSPNLLPPYKPPSPEPFDLLTLSCQTWHIAVRSHEQNTANNCFELSWAESPTSPVWREVTSTWWRADLRAGRRGAGNLHRPLLQFSDWDPVCEPWCEHVESGAATRVSEVDPSRSSSNVPWAPYGPGPELSLHPRRSDDMFQLRTTCDTAPEDYIHLISGYSIMNFFHLQIISTFFMDAEFLQLNS